MQPTLDSSLFLIMGRVLERHQRREVTLLAFSSLDLGLICNTWMRLETAEPACSAAQIEEQGKTYKVNECRHKGPWGAKHDYRD